MTAVTTGAVDASVLRSANRVLCENVAIHTGNPFIPLHWCLPDPITGLAPARSGVTKNLGEGACTAVADHFNGERPSTVHSGGYISWVSLDQAIYKIAQAVGHASNSASPHHAEGFGLFYFGTNDAYSTEQGHHWIAIFIEVLPFDNQEGVRARGAVLGAVPHVNIHAAQQQDTTANTASNQPPSQDAGTGSSAGGGLASDPMSSHELVLQSYAALAFNALVTLAFAIALEHHNALVHHRGLPKIRLPVLQGAVA